MVQPILGKIENRVGYDSFSPLIKSEFPPRTVSHYGFLLSPLDNQPLLIDVLLVVPQKGIIAIMFGDPRQNESLQNKADEILIQLQQLLISNKELRKGIKLKFDIPVVTFHPDGELEKIYPNEDSFSTVKLLLDSLPDIDESLFKYINESLDAMASTKPAKPRKSIQEANSRGYKIKAIEKEVANLDEWQKKAAYEVPDQPQRIRGLAGSGKTVVLALKAAYLHTLEPDADILVTFYSRALIQQFKSLVENFFSKINRNGSVDWDKLSIIPAWGSNYTEDSKGFYSVLCDNLDVPPPKLQSC